MQGQSVHGTWPDCSGPWAGIARPERVRDAQPLNRTRRREARNAPQGVERAERKEGTPMGKKKKGLSPKEKAALMKAAAKLIASVAALLTAIALWR